MGRAQTVDGTLFAPGELLAVFIRQALRLAGVTDVPEQVAGLMLTTRKITRELVGAVREANVLLKLPANRCFLQNYEESFYYYTLYQKPELYSRKVGLFIFSGERVEFRRMEMNAKVKPTLVKIGREPFVELPTENELRDKAFCRYAEEALDTDVYSTIFLVGDGFDRSWAKASVLFLSRHKRRVFMGNNLYVKGACFAAREKAEERTLKGYLFMSEDVIRINIGMNMLVNGSQAHYSLIPAGLNWYEAVRDVEFLLDGTDELEFQVSRMEDGKKTRYCMALPDLPKRPARATRLKLHLEYISAKKCRICVKDEGFGDLYPASGLCWEETFEG